MSLSNGSPIDLCHELLSTGQLDAVLSARPPASFRPGGPIRRLLTDPRATEEAYFATTAVFPIMHVVALRREVHERHPWMARNLTDAFVMARDNGLARLADVTASRVPLPWAADEVERTRRVFGADP